jgi:hypothetical protein
MTEYKHYVYKIQFETGHVYFGSRSCKCEPEDDVEYLGSPATYKNHWEQFVPTKIILRKFDTRKEANAYENILIEWAWSINKSLSLNASILGVTFSTQGKIWTEKERNNKAKSFYIVSPGGIVFEGLNLVKFCEENNLSKAHTHRVVKGEELQHKGWTASIEAHKLYLSLYKNRGVGKSKEGWSVYLELNGKRKKYFTNLEKAIEHRDYLIENGRSIVLNSKGWREKLEEIKNNGRT